MPARRIPALLIAAGTAALLTVLAGCSAGSGSASPNADGYVADGKFTVATGEPAYFPYVIDDKPQTGKGFEAAVAYAVADELGFAKKDVVWTRSTFDQGIAPGAKDWDVNLQQYTITDERAENVDFSASYYSTPQAVITIKGSKAAGVKDLAGFAALLVGAATGTTSQQAAEQTLKPSGGVQAFNSNDDAVLALKSGQIDALVVDLPTAFYLTGAELDDGVLIGQLPAADGVSDDWGIVLPKGSPLTKKVDAAVKKLEADGTLKKIADEWLGADAGAPVLK
ncbi:ABC transporter substrate-binding protein [Schumannella soli]|uniref:Amino acid ABC transporter substrate-binding protein n=1 Tax=Schumannella soli TaxID=2590779 RepID=A0A506Y2V4_9MICO|nr:ABC transporter substrate-binding protein [Schumannella soli]TPW75757.1 amino acid ABC transporter substrate-binding protein [Schumannella soli]